MVVEDDALGDEGDEEYDIEGEEGEEYEEEVCVNILFSLSYGMFQITDTCKHILKYNSRYWNS